MEWCFANGVDKYFIFGLMKSGLGDNYIKKYGNVTEAEVQKKINDFNCSHPSKKMKVIYYDYLKNAECILVYGDGRVIIDPCIESATFQFELGNILTNTREQIIGRFRENPNNYPGYCEHLNKHDKWS